MVIPELSGRTQAFPTNRRLSYINIDIEINATNVLLTFAQYTGRMFAHDLDLDDEGDVLRTEFHLRSSWLSNLCAQEENLTLPTDNDARIQVQLARAERAWLDSRPSYNVPESLLEEATERCINAFRAERQLLLNCSNIVD